MDREFVTWVHQQRALVRRHRVEVGLLRARRAGGYAVGLEEREVDRLDAVVVADAEPGLALQRVDGQCRAPVRVVTAQAVRERGEAGRVELHLEEGAAAAGVVAVR